MTSNTSVSYLDCFLCIDNGKLVSRFYNRRDDFNYPIVNFPFLGSNIPSAPACGVYVSQLASSARTCSKYQDFVDRGKLPTIKLLSQGYREAKLLSAVKNLCERYHDLVEPYNMAVSKLILDLMASVET